MLFRSLLLAGHDRYVIVELHAGLGQLLQLFIDRRVHQCGKLADGGLRRHSVSVSFGGGHWPCAGWNDSTAVEETSRRGAVMAACGRNDLPPASPAIVHG